MPLLLLFLFFCHTTPTTAIYTLSLHDALPIFDVAHGDAIAVGDGEDQARVLGGRLGAGYRVRRRVVDGRHRRSEEHTSELQSRQYLVCRLLLEKKKNKKKKNNISEKRTSSAYR